MALHVNRPPMDDFGNRVKWREVTGVALGTPEEEASSKLDALLDRWEVATSTYGGDSISDCVEV